MKAFPNNTWIAMILLSFALRAAAANYTNTFPVTLHTNQIVSGPFIVIPGPTKDKWGYSPFFNPRRLLQTGDTLTLDFNFNHPLQATDLISLTDTNEGIFWTIHGDGVLPVSQTMPYQWQFFSPAGVLFSNIISGNGVLRDTAFGFVQGAINPSQTWRALNLTDDTFTFTGLRLTVTIPTIDSGWTPNSMHISFASDQVKIASLPAPTGLIATAVSSSQIDLRWNDNSSTETSFVVGQSTTSGGPYTNIAILSANTTNCSSTNLAPETTFFLWCAWRMRVRYRPTRRKPARKLLPWPVLPRNGPLEETMTMCWGVLCRRKMGVMCWEDFRDLERRGTK